MKKSDSIRQALKEMGYNSRQVSVKDRPGGMSYSFTLTIRDAAVDYNKVETIKHQFTSIDRCEASGEILSGGNTFMHINITDEVRTAWASEFLPSIASAIAELVDESHGKKINDRFIIFKHNDHVLKIWDEKKHNWLRYNYSINDLESMGVELHIESFEPTAATPQPVAVVESSDTMTLESITDAMNSDFSLNAESPANKIIDEAVKLGYILRTSHTQVEWTEKGIAALTPAPEPTPGQVQIIDYSDRAIAVIGDTKPIKEKLKELRGRFNAHLTCGAGWIFPKTRLEEITNALNS